jgi:hypothetical protein
MNDEQRVRQRLRGDLELIRAPEPQLEQVIGRARRRRTRSLLAAVTIAGLVLIGLGVPLILLSPIRGAGPATPGTTPTPPATSPQPTTTQRLVLPAARPGWVWHTEQASRVAVQAPKSWTFKSGPMGLAAPRALFALGTGPIPAGGDCAPRAAIRALPKDGALLWVLEYTGGENPYEFPPRPARFDLGPLAGPLECVGERTHLIRFRQAGRFFQVHVLFGPRASAALRVEVAAALSSFIPEAQGTSSGQLCRQGSWVYCPEAAWVFQIIDGAGLFHWGNTGQAIEAGPENAKVEVWATRADPAGLQTRYQPVTVADGITVYGDRTQLVWEAQGFDIWIRPAGSSNAGLPTGKALERLVKASLEVPFVDDRS